MSKENSMGEKITLCPGCNCMTHTATLNKCGKCGATKPTAPADEGDIEGMCLHQPCPDHRYGGCYTCPGVLDGEIHYPELPDGTSPGDIIATLQAALDDARTDSRQQEDRVERLVTENKKLKVALSDEGESIHEKLWAEQRKNDDARKWPCVYCGKKDALIKLLKGKVAELELEVDCLGEEAAQVTCERNGYEFHMEKAEAALAEKEKEAKNLTARLRLSAYPFTQIDNKAAVECGRDLAVAEKRIEELEGKVPYPHLPKLQPVNYTKSILDGWEKAEAKLLSAEAVVEAAREYTARLKVAIDDGVTRESEEELEESSDTFEAALSAHDNQIEEGLSE